MELEDFNCPLCGKIYDENLYTPRLLLKCGHTYCELCLKQNFSKNKNIFTCPDDNFKYQKIKNIDEFPKNITLLNILKKTKLRNSFYQSLEINKIKNKFHIENLSNVGINKNKDFSPEYLSAMNFSFMSLSNNKNSLKKINSKNNLNFDNLSSNRKDSITLKNSHPIINEFNLEFSLYDGGTNCTSITSNNCNDSNIINTVCLFHSRKKEIICLDCKVKICTNCALFGDHKNHIFKNEDDVIKELFVKSEILIEYFEMVENFSTKLDEFENKEYKSNSNKLKIESKEKETYLKEKVSGFFYELKFLLKEKEKKMIYNISHNFEEEIHNKISYFDKGIKPLKENIKIWKIE